MSMAGVARRKPLIAAALAVAVLVVAAGNAVGVAAQIGAPPALPACPSFILALSPCLGYVTGLNNASNPICCAAITAVVNNAPACLCQFFAAPSPLGIPMNLTRVRDLPNACMISASSFPQCTGAGVSFTPPNIAPGSIPAPLTTPPASFFPAPPTAGVPIPAPGTPSSLIPLSRRGSPPPVHNTSNSSTGSGSNHAAKTNASSPAPGVDALSRKSGMSVCLGIFFAIWCFM